MIVELLHKVAEMEHQETDEFEYFHRPSVAGPDRCIRQMVYQARGEEKEGSFGGRALHVFNDGHWHEELTNEWIQKTAFTLHSQQMPVKITMLGLTISGKIDGIVTDLLGVDRLYEHKGLNHFTSERYWHSEEYPEDYLCQCAIYLRGLQDVNPDISEAVLIIKNKNTAAFMEYLLQYDRNEDALTIVRKTNHLGEMTQIGQVREQIVAKAFHKFLEVDQHKTHNSLPDRPYDLDDWHCQYCPYQQPCWASLPEEVASLAPEGELEPEMADVIRYYKEVSAQIADMEKEKDGLRGNILKILKDKGIKKGKAGEYIATMSISQIKRLDKELIPAHLVDQYSKETWMTRLTVKNLNEQQKRTGPKKGKVTA